MVQNRGRIISTLLPQRTLTAKTKNTVLDRMPPPPPNAQLSSISKWNHVENEKWCKRSMWRKPIQNLFRLLHEFRLRIRTGFILCRLLDPYSDPDISKYLKYT